MPYQIDRFNGVPLVTVEDGTIDQTTDLKFVGKNYAGYGEIQNENFLFLLENFSNTVAPAKPLSGQIWFDSSSKKLKFYDNIRWRTTGGAEFGPTAPAGLTAGDFWFKSDTDQLYSWNGAQFILIGPPAVVDKGTTLLESVEVLDTLGNKHAIIKALVNGVCVFIISSDPGFTLNAINPISGFTYIAQGTTLPNSASGSTTSDYRWWGTATDSDRLGGFTANDFVKASAAIFTNTSSIASFPDSGYTVGDDDDLLVSIVSGNIPTINNQLGSKISFKITDGTSKEPLRIDAGTVVPGLTDTYDLGTLILRWRNLYAKNIFADEVTANKFNGLADKATDADRLLFNSGYRSAAATATANSIVARDASGNFAANIITATSTRAQYADLAERFEADSFYEAGTVVALGGPAEITAVAEELSDEVFGVVSTRAAYLMNATAGDDLTHPAVAMTGRVPVRAKGTIKKGDRLVSAGNGLARAAKKGEATGLNTIGRALENKTSQGEGIVLAVVKIN